MINYLHFQYFHLTIIYFINFTNHQILLNYQFLKNPHPPLLILAYLLIYICFQFLNLVLVYFIKKACLIHIHQINLHLNLLTLILIFLIKIN